MEAYAISVVATLAGSTGAFNPEARRGARREVAMTPAARENN
jgi:hypothetical protein